MIRVVWGVTGIHRDAVVGQAWWHGEDDDGPVGDRRGTHCG